MILKPRAYLHSVHQTLHHPADAESNAAMDAEKLEALFDQSALDAVEARTIERASLRWPATEIERLRAAMREAQPFCMAEGARILQGALNS